MKYLKLYESFETDLEDILLEVQDLGYVVKIDSHEDKVRYAFNQIIIYGRGDVNYPLFNHNIKMEEIKDCVLRLKDYLGDKYMGCFAFYRGRNWEIYQFTEDSYFISPVIGILIRYKII